MNEHIVKPVGTRWLLAGCLLAGIGVALGAFGAHGLKGHFKKTLDDPTEAARRLDIWETGVRYQMFHALALLALGLATRTERGASHAAGVAFTIGIGIFSGCLYALSLTDVRVLGAIVPLGGVAFLVGWTLFGWSLARSR